MARGEILSVHSFRGGTGKSNTTANLAALLARAGKRVGVVDTDIASPGIHVLLGLDPQQVEFTLNDFLWGRCAIEQAAHDVGEGLGIEAPGGLFLIPSSMRTGAITQILREGYDVVRLNDGLRTLMAGLALDVLLIDTHPGVNEETLLSIAISDTLLILLRPDQQDYQGTGVTVEVARMLEVPRIWLVVNKAPPGVDLEGLAERVAQTYGADVAAVLPHSAAMLALGSEGLIALREPDAPVSRALQNVVARLLGTSDA